jgi:undecaprenyl-diphosphatase
MPTTVEAALLGIVQGVTEFLPVSSSGHLILARAFFGLDADKFGLAFDVACHVGTLLAVVIYFWRDVAAMIAAVPRLADPQGTRGARLVWLLAIGTIPAVVVGALFAHVIEDRTRTPEVAMVTLALVGLLFFVAERVGAKTRGEESLKFSDAFWIGCAQAAALVPGVSRSGATITAALFLGLRRAEAARFVFLLSIPAILAAAGYELPQAVGAMQAGEGTLFAIGVVTSAVTGYLAVKYFIRYLANHSLDAFAWYRLALAAAAAVWLVQR